MQPTVPSTPQVLLNLPLLPSLYPSPLTSTSPHPRAPKFCLAILSISNIQEVNYMIFFGFTFLFSFSRVTNYRLSVLYLWLEHSPLGPQTLSPEAG